MPEQEQIAGYLGRIFDHAQPVGTCFQIVPNIAVTAWHVLDDIGAAKVGSISPVDALLGGYATDAKVMALNPACDLAVLRLQRPLPESVRGLISTSSIPLAKAVAVTGVPDIADSHTYRYIDAFGRWSGGTMRDGTLMLGRLTCSALVRGMSGAPVIVDDGFVCGVVSSRYNSADGWLRDTVWIARTEDLVPMLSDFEDVLTAYHGPHLGETRSATSETMLEFAAQSREGMIVPQQLPPRLSDFIGRQGGMEKLASSARTTGLIAISGPGGIGKTSMAVELAYRLIDRYPDGQLYADLKGIGGIPRDPYSVLASFLHALGIAASDLPAEPSDQEALFRSLTKKRRVIVMLDNVGDADSVRPMVSPSSDCLTIVTSRRPVVLLDGESMTLDPLEPNEALQLLRSAGAGLRVQDEVRAAEEVITYCDGFPLALRVAGARLRLRQHWTLARLASHLCDERRRLETLALSDRSVRASIQLSYDALPATHRDIFVKLSIFPGQSFPVWIGSAVAGDYEFPLEVLDELVDAQLVKSGVDDTAGQLRYYYHDLIRLFAAEKVHEDQSNVYSRVYRQFGEAYLGVAVRLCVALEPHGFPKSPDLHIDIDASRYLEEIRNPALWFEAERVNLSLLIAQLCQNGSADLAWRLAESIPKFVVLGGFLSEWSAIYKDGLSAARLAADAFGEGVMLHMLGITKREQGYWQEGLELLEHSTRIFEQLQRPREQAFSLIDCSVACRVGEQWVDGVEFLKSASEIFEELGDGRGAAEAKREIGTLYWFAGDLALAEGYLTESLPFFERVKDVRWVAYATARLGDVLRQRQDWRRAESYLTQSIQTLDALGDSRWAATTKIHMADCFFDQGRLLEALALYVESADVLEDLRDPVWESVAREGLLRAYDALARYDEKLITLRRLGELYARTGSIRKYQRTREAIDLLGRLEH